jgi:hypothetical protein
LEVKVWWEKKNDIKDIAPMHLLLEKLCSPHPGVRHKEQQLPLGCQLHSFQISNSEIKRGSVMTITHLPGLRMCKYGAVHTLRAGTIMHFPPAWKSQLTGQLAMPPAI